VAYGEVRQLLQFENRPIEVTCEDSESSKRLKELIQREPWLDVEKERTSDHKFHLISQGRSLADIHCFLVENNIRLEQFTTVRKTLKDFFLTLTNFKK
jgi:hypothetical protein